MNLRALIKKTSRVPLWIWIAIASIVIGTITLAIVKTIGKKRREGYVEASDKKYPFWGWGPNAGLRCANNNNTGCNTAWIDGKLVDMNVSIDCKAPKMWKNDQCVCVDPLAIDGPDGSWCTQCKAPFAKKNGQCACPGNKVWRNNQCMDPIVDCKAPKMWKNDQCVCVDPLATDGPDGSWCTQCKAPFAKKDGQCACPGNTTWKDGYCQELSAPSNGGLPDFTWDQRVRQCRAIGRLMPGGHGDGYVCKENPNIRRGFGENKYAWDIEWQCCKNTNYDCHTSGIKGVWQKASQAGLKPSGYYTDDDGCNLDVFGLDGAEIAVNKISGLWAANPLVRLGQGDIFGGLGAMPFVPPAFKLAAKGGDAAQGAGVI